MCPALKGIPGTDRHTYLFEVRTHICTPEAIMGFRERFSLSLNDKRCRVTPGLKKKWKREGPKECLKLTCTVFSLGVFFFRSSGGGAGIRARRWEKY